MIINSVNKINHAVTYIVNIEYKNLMLSYIVEMLNGYVHSFEQRTKIKLSKIEKEQIKKIIEKTFE